MSDASTLRPTAPRLRSWRALPVLLLTALALSAGPSAAVNGDGHAAGHPDHVVQAGALASDPLKMYEYQDYFPRTLQVHRGDRVRWTFPMRTSENLAFHTVTFAKDPAQVPLVRPDELPGEMAFAQATFFSTGCGRPGQPVCVITAPLSVVSSGAPALYRSADGGIQTFDAVIDLPPGTYHYFCSIHDPVMRGTLQVVPDRVALRNPTPRQLAAEIARMEAEADALVRRLSVPRAVDEGSRRTWTVHAGARTRERGGIGVIGFLPASLRVTAGDSVRWTVSDSVHGVTFPSPGHGAPSTFFGLSCDPDDPSGGSPGMPMLGLLEVNNGPGCPGDTVPEAVLTAAAASPVVAPGGAVTSPLTVHSSGMLVYSSAPDRLRGRPAGSGAHWGSAFQAQFPLAFLDSATYRCEVHQDIMGGSVTVEAA